METAIDPESLTATEPADIDVCSFCRGAGERIVRDYYRMCGFCVGSGEWRSL